MDDRKKYFCPTTVLWTICIFLILVFALSATWGRYPVSATDAGRILFSLFNDADADVSHRAQTVLLNIRLPRLVLACLVGAALSGAGAAYQGVFQNPMASPDLLGASSGAAFGAALGLLCGFPSSFTMASAFGFSLLTTVAVWSVSVKSTGNQVLTLILAGIMVSSLFAAMTSFIKLVADPMDELPAITYWLMGSLAGAKKATVLFALFPIGAGLIPLMLMRWKINLLSLGDDEARTLGVDSLKTRLIVILSTTLATAGAVAVSGVIGWVGLVVPHLARRLVGNNYRYLMPASILLGALFLLVVDDFSRNLISSEIPLGILTAFIGAPFFLYLILRRGNSL